MRKVGYRTPEELKILTDKSRPETTSMPDNYCMVYESRPRACREYPHTDRKRFYQILDLSHKNCETCVVVYEIFEDMKKKEW